ncbi:heat shock 70 kDa protein cognate 1-like protein [Tanacetum coccineum]
MGKKGEAPAIGIDLGTTYSCVAIWQNNRVEIIPNEQGNRTTPSCVAFTCTERFIGDAARNQVAMNPANSVIYAGQGSGHGNQDNYPNQDYSMGHGSAHGSVPVDDDSPVEEMLPIKSKKPLKRTSKAKKNDNNEPAKDWTTMEEITL